MTLRLRNTLGRRLDAVAADGPVRIYTCGPTVYRPAHLGNLRSYLLADVLRRVLLYHGLAVRHVKNVTDVGHLVDERQEEGPDRMLLAAEMEGKPPTEIAAAYEARFHADEARLNILPANVYPRASEHVTDMLRLVEALVDRGSAYVAPSGIVYFAVETDPTYGELSGNDLDRLRAGHRAAVDPEKRHPADFALWRPAGPGRLLAWPSARFGRGFPGWHIECTTMGLRYLGPEFEIHTGGIDNVFPHHEDEIAQARALTGRLPARIWVHGEHLLMGGRKMAKSAGNVLLVDDLVERGLDPLAFRYLCATVRYGHKLRATEASLAAADAGLRSLRATLRSLGPPPADGPWAAPLPLRAAPPPPRPEGIADGPTGHGRAEPPFPLSDRAHAPTAPLSPAGRRLHDRFVHALDDDLDLPRALGVVREILAADLAADERRWLVLDADVVLGLDLDRVWDRPPEGRARVGVPTRAAAPPEDVRRLAAARAEARSRHDFETADRLRAELAARGWRVVDRP
ncbi:MAG TPA: hypothetical protein VNO86_01165, partial [Candidatus Binatia bacterium]|nr:hypothetical protein [Candidatus Binatia bacterium]